MYMSFLWAGPEGRTLPLEITRNGAEIYQTTVVYVLITDRQTESTRIPIQKNTDNTYVYKFPMQRPWAHS
jgi:hypothetical protein